MRRATGIMLMLVIWLSQAAGAASDPVETQKSQENKGITVEDLGRALKSAEQNIEKEIPKILPAIEKTFKQVTGKDSEKQSPQSTEKQKK